MALSLGNNSARGSVGLDIDGGFLAAVQAGAGRIEQAVSTELPAELISDGEVSDAEGLSAELRDFFKHSGLPRNVRLGVSNEQIVVRPMDLPRIEVPAELEAAVRFQASEAIPMPLEEAVLDYQVAGYRNDGEEGPRMQVIVVAARRAMVDRLVAATRGAGLRPEGIDLDAFALVRALAAGAEPDGIARVYCHLAGVTNLAVAVGPTCVFTRPLRSGWDGDEVDTVASQLADEIGLSIDYYMAQPDARPIDELVISGPGAKREGLAEGLGARLQRPAVVAEPLGGLDASALGHDEDPYRHTVAAGLALGAA
jgi:type IV pilus assembly protein PilM